MSAPIVRVPHSKIYDAWERLYQKYLVTRTLDDQDYEDVQTLQAHVETLEDLPNAPR